MNFNYQKAYFTFALPAFRNLSAEAKRVHSELIPLVGGLAQGRDLSIPLNDTIRELLASLTTLEIAQLSRASYFVGHWKPVQTESVFPNTKGESWKIANCCDQILRGRLTPPHNIQIHEGKLRVTFSNRNCWLWEEFALATEENLAIFEGCKLPFDALSLEKSASTLKKTINNLWDYDNPEDNEGYQAYLKSYEERELAKLRQKVTNLVPDAEKKAKKLIDNAKIETEAFTWLLDHLYCDLDNVIYYTHTGRFCFGWRTPIKSNQVEYGKLCELLEEFPFDYDIK